MAPSIDYSDPSADQTFWYRSCPQPVTVFGEPGEGCSRNLTGHQGLSQKEPAPLTPSEKEENELEKLEKKRTEIQKTVKRPCVVLVILAIVVLLIIFVKMHDNPTSEGNSVPEVSKQNHTEVKEEGREEVKEEVKEKGREEVEVEVKESNPTSEDVAADGSDIRPVTFDLEHAITVGESIHLSENGDLEWQGKIVHHKGGTLGAYEEAVNIFNGTDYHIYEVYDVLVNAHPELKTDHLEPYECEDINDYYGFTVSRAPAEINEIDNALREGRLVQLQVHSNEWRDAEGKQVDWPGYHSGLIFYFDGSLYHMKASGTINQKNAVYTREQLIDWIGGTSKQLVIYTKHSAE